MLKGLEMAPGIKPKLKDDKGKCQNSKPKDKNL